MCEMIAKWQLTLLNVISLIAQIQSIIFKDIGYFPDYANSFENKGNLRDVFIEKKRENIATARRIRYFDNFLSNDSIFIDGIFHGKVDENHKELSLVNKIEAAFRDLVGMKGVVYNFKRDVYWRTWRKVEFPDGDKMVCYRCEGKAGCKDCEYSSYWNIDETFSCAYEIISVIDNVKVCTIDFTNSTNVEDSCPCVVQFTEILKTCDNPIETKWLIQKDYKKEVFELYPGIFCEGRDFCNITTLYTITPKHIAFQIVNSTNHVIYSKIMKNNNTNYACATDCGIWDPVTKTISKTNEPLIIDLNPKEKREDNLIPIPNKTDNKYVTQRPNDVKDGNTGTVTVRSKNGRAKLNYAINIMETAFNLPFGDVTKTGNHHHHDMKHPTCSSMRHHMEEDISDDVN